MGGLHRTAAGFCDHLVRKLILFLPLIQKSELRFTKSAPRDPEAFDHFIVDPASGLHMLFCFRNSGNAGFLPGLRDLFHIPYTLMAVLHTVFHKILDDVRRETEFLIPEQDRIRIRLRQIPTAHPLGCIEHLLHGLILAEVLEIVLRIVRLGRRHVFLLFLPDFLGLGLTAK